MRGHLLIAFALALCSAAALAQEFEIFDPNDFIDPRERGAAYSEKRMEFPGRPFTVARIYIGGVRDYEYRDTPSSARVAFAHITWSRYSGNEQVNVKVTGYGVDSSTNLPRYRGTLQFGHYFVIPEGEGGARAAGRILVSGSLDENPQRDVAAPVVNSPFVNPLRDETTCSSFCPESRAANSQTNSGPALNRSFAVALDTYVAIPYQGRELAATGSIVWSRRIIDTGRYADRFLYYYRGPNTDISHNVRLSVDMSAGAERTNAWHSAYRSVLKGSWDIPYRAGKRFGTINVAYAPAYMPGQHPHWWNEAAIYFDRTIFAHLGK